MSFRNRPVLDRKHRPRWQDELRTQQLVVAGFAVAIALALGIFGATAWNGYWDGHLRPVATVGGTTLDRSDLSTRASVIEAELVARINELQSMLGGPQDQVIEQQLQSLSSQLQTVQSTASDSLVRGLRLTMRAEEFGVTVTDEQIDAEILERRTKSARAHLNLVLIDPLPEGAVAETEPTEEQLEAARAEAQLALDRINSGQEFSAVATQVSSDPSSQSGGDLGWVVADDRSYGEYFDVVADAEVGDIVGPVDVEDGVALVRLVERRPAGVDESLVSLLELVDRDGTAYRAYIRDHVMEDAYNTHFKNEVAVSPQPQRRVGQIFIAVAGEPIPQHRARHVLIMPIPGQQDQSAATEEQWAAALTEAEEVRALLAEPDADWFAIAGARSDDTGSGQRGGDLGWYDPQTAATAFVPEFATALAGLALMELSEPVRTQFGYHIIQRTGERESPQAQAEDLAAQLADAPDDFAEIATLMSEDDASAREGGELGWVAPYQLVPILEDAIFALDEVGAISEPIETADGIYIFTLLETAERRTVEADQMAEIRDAGFDRWLEAEVTGDIDVWVDPEFASATATG